jgi:hypothetical protein
MTVSYSATLKNTRMQDVINAIDGQAAVGTIEIGTAGMATVLVIISLQKPSFNQASGVITMLGVPLSGTATAGGTAASARIKDGSGTIQVSGLTVSTTGADINLNSVTINNGQVVTLNSGTITHSP